MNVLLVPSSYAPNIGGVEAMTRGLARELHARGHGVAVLTARWPGTLPERQTIDGIDVRRMEFPLPSRRIRDAVRFLASLRPTVGQVERAARECDADVIHVHCLGPNTLYAALAARRLGVPLVLTTHGELQGDDTAMRRSGVMRRVHRWAMRRAGWVTACSRFTLEAARVPAGTRSSVVYNAIAGGTENPVTEECVLFCAARLTHNKGVDLLIRAFGIGAANLGATELWIAGDGAERASLERLCAELGLGGKVRFLGALSPDEVRGHMARCLCYVCPSRNEGFGLAALEAMAAGKAVVATRVGGVPEVIVDGETGVLVEPEDVSAMARAITGLSTDAQARRSFGEAGRRRAQLFSWDVVAAGYLNVYKAADAARGARGVRSPIRTAVRRAGA